MFDDGEQVVVFYCDFFYWFQKLLNFVYFIVCCFWEIMFGEIEEVGVEMGVVGMF